MRATWLRCMASVLGVFLCLVTGPSFAETADTCGDSDAASLMRRSDFITPQDRLRTILADPDITADQAMSVQASLAEAYLGNRQQKEAEPLIASLLANARQSNHRVCMARAFWLKEVLALQRGDTPAAIESAQRALDILGSSAAQSILGARINRTLGHVYYWKNDTELSNKAYESAATIWRSLGDSWGAAGEDVNIAINEERMGALSAALDRNQRALKVLEQFNDQAGQAAAKENIASIYLTLGQPRRSQEQWLSALDLRTAISDRAGIATDQIALAWLYFYSAMPEEARKSMHAAEQLISAGEDVREYVALLALKAALSLSDDDPNASVRASRACVEASAYSTSMQAGCQVRWADALLKLGKIELAEQHAQTALLKAEEAQSLSQIIGASEQLSEIYAKQLQPEKAIFFGKIAVNHLQDLRRGARGMAPEDQQILLETRRWAHVHLANLLISQGRGAEAQQVLTMMKQQELFDYVRGDSLKETTSVDIQAQGPELLWAQGYLQRVAAMIQSAHSDAKSGLEERGREFLDFIAAIHDHPEAKDEPNRTQRPDSDWIRRLAIAPKGTVLLQYLIANDGMKVLLSTANEQQSFTIESNPQQIASTARALLQVLGDPSSDPLPAANEAYQQWFSPIEPTLKKLKARTLWLSLDGPLRLVPFNALYDGKSWLAQKYVTVVLTEALGPPALIKQQKHTPRVAALGVSKAGEGFSELPHVPEELASIVRTEERDSLKFVKDNNQGILPGQIYLDEQFSLKALEGVFAKTIPLVHIASHFRLSPGNDTDSFLLLGDRTHWTVHDFRLSKDRLDNVTLLTLSACETALNGTGNELEGFSAVAQLKGAQAVLASLWPVSDAGTEIFMHQYYEQIARDPLSFASALSHVQKSFLTESAMHGTTQRTRLLGHPFFWAPFIVMGSAQ